MTGALVLKSYTHTQTLGYNGAGDWWARWVCPLNRPINLDEALAAPSQIFPSAYFLSCVPLLFPPSLPHSLRWKSLVRIVAAGSRLCILQNGEIFIVWDMGMIWRSLFACGEGWRSLSPRGWLKQSNFLDTRVDALPRRRALIHNMYIQWRLTHCCGC